MLSIIKSISGNFSIVTNGAYTFRKIIPSPVNFSVKYFTKKTAIRKRLGVPEPPKKPSNAFMRFVQETRKSAPGTQREILKLAASQWQNMDEEEKQIYYQGYKEALNQYLKEVEEYNKSIGQDTVTAIEKEMKQQHELRLQNIEKRSYGNMLQELGKPKRVVGAYFQFRLDRLKLEDRDPVIKELWATLDETKKKKYFDQSAKRREMYNKQLIQWEARMVAQGRGHLVRTCAMEKHKIKQLEITGIIKKK